MTSRFSVLAFAALLLANAAHAAPVHDQGTWETTLQGRDLDSDGMNDAFYDTSLNITWLANANANGKLSLTQATSWAANLVVGAYDDWRLPQSFGGHGFQPGASASEMAHLYYETLGNLGAPINQGSPDTSPWGLHNTADFVDMRPNPYWLASDTSGGWGTAFSNYFGYQGEYPSDYALRAIAVRDGDVTVSPVPEPSTCLLMLAGLGALVSKRPKRSELDPQRLQA